MKVVAISLLVLGASLALVLADDASPAPTRFSSVYVEARTNFKAALPRGSRNAVMFSMVVKRLTSLFEEDATPSQCPATCQASADFVLKEVAEYSQDVCGYACDAAVHAFMGNEA